MAQSLSRLLIHLVFSTKERAPLLGESVRDDLNRYHAAVLNNMKCPMIITNCVEDHVHMLFVLHRTLALSKVVEEVKKASSKWLKTQGLAGFSWQNGYGAFTIGESQRESVCRYVENQEAHHRKLSFQEELRRFLDKYNVEYDERYVWD